MRGETNPNETFSNGAGRLAKAAQPGMGKAGGQYSLAVRTSLSGHMSLPEVSNEFAPAFTDIFHLFKVRECYSALF